MATGTNAIATVNDVVGITNDKSGIADNYPGYLCCTKELAIELGADSTKLSNYTTNQLVKYSDIFKKPEVTFSYTTVDSKTLYICLDFKIPQTIINSYSKQNVYVEVVGILTYENQYSQMQTVMLNYDRSPEHTWDASSSHGEYWAYLNFTGQVRHYSDVTPVGTLQISINLYAKNPDSGSEDYILIASFDPSKTTSSYYSNVNSDFHPSGQTQLCNVFMNDRDDSYTIVVTN